MSYVANLFDHPFALLVAVLLAAPLVWRLAKAWFPNVEEDIKEAAPYAFIDAIGGPDIGDLVQDRRMGC